MQVLEPSIFSVSWSNGRRGEPASTFLSKRATCHEPCSGLHTHAFHVSGVMHDVCIQILKIVLYKRAAVVFFKDSFYNVSHSYS